MPKKFKRKKKKQYPMVAFTIPSVYGDAVFEIPKQSSFTLKAQRGIQSGNLDLFFSELKQAKVDQETMDALDDLQGGDETQEFLEAWSEAGPVPVGKSSD